MTQKNNKIILILAAIALMLSLTACETIQRDTFAKERSGMVAQGADRMGIKDPLDRPSDRPDNQRMQNKTGIKANAADRAPGEREVRADRDP
ncbi:MAG: hypothetical protein ABIC95_03025 [archaeon]